MLPVFVWVAPLLSVMSSPDRLERDRQQTLWVRYSKKKVKKKATTQVLQSVKDLSYFNVFIILLLYPLSLC